MESIKRLSDVDPQDLKVVERVFGQRIDVPRQMVLILKAMDAPTIAKEGGVPSWCDVLEGMSEDELADFDASLNEPIRITRSSDVDGS